MSFNPHRLNTSNRTPAQIQENKPIPKCLELLIKEVFGETVSQVQGKDTNANAILELCLQTYYNRKAILKSQQDYLREKNNTPQSQEKYKMLKTFGYRLQTKEQWLQDNPVGKDEYRKGHKVIVGYLVRYLEACEKAWKLAKLDDNALQIKDYFVENRKVPPIQAILLATQLLATLDFKSEDTESKYRKYLTDETKRQDKERELIESANQKIA